MEEKIYEIIQKYLTNLGEGLDLRDRLHKIYKRSCYGVMDWVLLSGEGKLKIIVKKRFRRYMQNAFRTDKLLGHR